MKKRTRKKTKKRKWTVIFVSEDGERDLCVQHVKCRVQRAVRKAAVEEWPDDKGAAANVYDAVVFPGWLLPVSKNIREPDTDHEDQGADDYKVLVRREQEDDAASRDRQG